MNRKTVLIVTFAILIFLNSTEANMPYYENSYALVIGIDQYVSSDWAGLSYAVKDAESIKELLIKQEFKVTDLYNEQATRSRIILAMNVLARKLKRQDRVLIFFSGHGYTEKIGDKDFGYIVPYDGKDTADYISMDTLREQSQKLGTAKHQLFIMDSCYGGMLGVRSSVIDKDIPNYLEEITSRQARQVLMAGGRNQQVVDTGPEGHSPFTWSLIKALGQGGGDLNRDGYITFSELQSYVVPSATNAYQTPSGANLPEHELGEFVFKAPVVYKSIQSASKEKDTTSDKAKRGGDTREVSSKEKKDELTQDLEKIQPTKPVTPVRDDVASVINIAGSWRDPNNPANGSRITQEGNSFQFNGWGVLPQGTSFESTGSGTITGQDITSTYTTRYRNDWIARGNCSGAVSRDGSRITLTCTDNILGTFVMSGVRK